MRLQMPESFLFCPMMWSIEVFYKGSTAQSPPDGFARNLSKNLTTHLTHKLCAVLPKIFLHNSARFGHTESVPFAGTCGGNFFQNWSDHYGDQKEKQQHSLFRDPVQAQHGQRKLLRSGLHLCGHSRIQPHCTGMHQL